MGSYTLLLGSGGLWGCSSHQVVREGNIRSVAWNQDGSQLAVGGAAIGNQHRKKLICNRQLAQSPWPEADTALARDDEIENADLSGGINYSMRGDSTTENLGAVLNDSSVMTIGASVAFKF